MSKRKLEPAGDMLLTVDTPQDNVMDGIALPDNMKQQEMVFGTVVFIGPVVAENNKTKLADFVAYGPYAGKKILLDGVEFRLLREGQIEAYVRTVPDPQE